MTTDGIETHPLGRWFIAGVVGIVVAFVINPLLSAAPFVVAALVVAAVWYPAELQNAIDTAMTTVAHAIPRIDWGALAYHGTALVALAVLAIALTAGALYVFADEEIRETFREGDE